MRINLLPEQFRPQPLVSPVRLLIMIVSSLLLVGVLFGLLYQSLQLKMERETLANITSQLELRQSAMAEVNQIEAKLAEITKRQGEIKKVMETYPAYHGLLKELAGALKNDIWLTNTDMASNGTFKISGKTLFFLMIGDFLKKLTQSGSYQSARLTNVSEVKEDESSHTVYTFDIEIETGEGAPEYATEKK